MNEAEEALASAEKLLEMRRLDAALRHLDEAEAMGAPASRCAAGRWQIHMLRGDFPAAWEVSRAIRKAMGTDENCLWRGEDVRGKRVMVRCLHGFGDAVQFIRYAPRLATLAKSVVWEVPPEMMQLARYFRGVERVVTWSGHPTNKDLFAGTPDDHPTNKDQTIAKDWDVQMEVMELPCMFGTRLSDLPIATDYLRLPRKLEDSVHAGMGTASAPRIGLVWAAGEWNPSRSIPVELLPRLLEVGGCEFWSLQGETARQVSGLDKLRETKLCQSGILALASVIQQLDLVITVDTLAAHLAGALGVEAWVMLQHAADWRWMMDREDSPWYPSLRLFRQPTPGNWAAVLHAVQYALQEWLGSDVEEEAA
jgi:hypothetical protein